MRVFGQGTDDQVRRKRTSLLESAGKEGWRKGEKRGVGLFKKKRSGAFFFYLVPRDRFVLDGAGSGIFALGAGSVFALDFGLNSAVLAVSI